MGSCSDRDEAYWREVEYFNSWYHEPGLVDVTPVFDLATGGFSVRGVYRGFTKRSFTNTGLYRAEVIRDAKLKEISKMSNTQKSKITTVIGAHDPATGRIAVGVKQTCKANAGKCAEDLAAEQLGNPSKIQFTKAVRPRTEKVIPRCDRCVNKYGPEK